jgi:hypothetical protein
MPFYFTFAITIFCSPGLFLINYSAFIVLFNWNWKLKNVNSLIIKTTDSLKFLNLDVVLKALFSPLHLPFSFFLYQVYLHTLICPPGEPKKKNKLATGRELFWICWTKMSRTVVVFLNCISHFIYLDSSSTTYFFFLVYSCVLGD